MTTQNETKLKTLFSILQSSNIITTDLLNTVGISNNLRNYYVKSSWIEPIGIGAYKKPNSVVYWQDAINAIQKQNNLPIFVGALTALNIQGYSHYLRYNNEILYLFSTRGIRLPKWFTSYDWKVNIFQKNTSFLPYDLGLKEVEENNTEITISSPERAILECLYLSPNKIDLLEIYHIFEGLVNLKPKLISQLLQKCNSIKVKRLFLYMAEKTNHQWFQFVETNKIDLGNGTREISKNGTYISKYLISVPKELAEI